ncbi:phage holin family protein [Anaerolineales bacterium]
MLKIFFRVLFLWIVESVSLFVLAPILPGLVIESWQSTLLLTAVIGLVNATLRPIIVGILSRFSLIIFLTTNFIINGLVIIFFSEFIPGVYVATVWTTIWMSIAMTLANTLCSELLSLNDASSYYYYITKQQLKRFGNIQETDVPGLIILEIDGLSIDVLREALGRGDIPHIQRWLREGTHELVSWETDWASQTCASQAGILHGSNMNIPAFRWYDKKTNRIWVANHPKDTSEIEQLISEGLPGLLINGGASLGNMFSGGADRSLFTVSTLLDRDQNRGRDYSAFFVNPYNFATIVIHFVGDLFHEYYSIWRQKRRKVVPYGYRGGIYPFIRATTTSILAELASYLVVTDMLAGKRSAYVTFVGYDEVAHHSGIREPDAFHVLKSLDHTFGKIESVLPHCPRPYKIVVLSDHGQSQGWTFEQRYHMSLSDLVQSLMPNDIDLIAELNSDETYSNLSSLLTDITQENSVTSRFIKRSMRHRISPDGTVTIRKDRIAKSARPTLPPLEDRPEVIVLGSGNLGLIYINELDRRMTLEEINEKHPYLIPGLVNHEGIGFIMVNTELNGPVAMGKEGIYYLEEDRIEGRNPLKDFGPNARQHLLRTNSFSNVADIMVNSFYDPETQEVAAFENLISCHGGLGGPQNHPVLIYPAEFPLPEGDIIGAESIYKILKSWELYLGQEVLEQTSVVTAQAAETPQTVS